MLSRTPLQIARLLGTLALALAFAASAAAQYNLPMMEGQWYQNRGPLVDIPVNGGPQLCGAAVGTEAATADGCVANFRPANGGIPQTSMAEVIVNAGTAPGEPAQMTIPPRVFGQNIGRQTTHVSIIPTVVQLDTHFTLAGPADTATFVGVSNVRPLGAMSSNVSTVGDRVFQKNAWQFQAGRMAQSFQWCPEVGSMCTDPRPSINGGPVPSLNGRIAYSNPDGNGYGGAMNMLLDIVTNTGGTWVQIGTSGGVALLLRNPLSGMGRQHPGGNYATFDVNYLGDVTNGNGTIFLGFMTTMQTPGQSGASVGQTGPITGIGPSLGPGPADTSTNWGFPWTTGMVLVSNQDTTPTTITATGSDMRTRAGAGQITMVAGGLSHRIQPGANFVPLEVVTFTLPEPRSALGLGVSLAMIFGLYRLSQRR